MKFTIKRSEWIRGDEGDNSRLFNGSGQKCCLGFYSQACGVSEDDMYDVATPDQLSEPFRQKLPEWAQKWRAMGPLRNLIYANDLPLFKDGQREENFRFKFRTEAEREAKIKELFALQGDEVEFVD